MRVLSGSLHCGVDHEGIGGGWLKRSSACALGRDKVLSLSPFRGRGTEGRSVPHHLSWLQDGLTEREGSL